MKKLIALSAFLVLLTGLAIGWESVREVTAGVIEIFYGDPDTGESEAGINKEEFMIQRAEAIAGSAVKAVPDEAGPITLPPAPALPAVPASLPPPVMTDKRADSGMPHGAGDLPEGTPWARWRWAPRVPRSPPAWHRPVSIRGVAPRHVSTTVES